MKTFEGVLKESFRTLRREWRALRRRRAPWVTGIDLDGQNVRMIQMSDSGGKRRLRGVATVPLRDKATNEISEPTLEDLADLEQEQVDEILLDLRVRELLPQTEEEYEEWARKEYPHVMWLYDVLKEQYAYEGDWRDMLVRSGEIYRFDWPTTLKEPNCRPRIERLKYAALVTGYEIEFTEKGEHILPVLEWVEEDEKKLETVFLSLRETESLEAVLIPVGEVPEGYVETIAKMPVLIESVLVYLALSSAASGNVELVDLSQSAERLLRKRVGFAVSDVGSGYCRITETCLAVAQELRSLLEKRQGHIQRCARNGPTRLEKEGGGLLEDYEDAVRRPY
jgi:hypothetical protein